MTTSDRDQANAGNAQSRLDVDFFRRTLSDSLAVLQGRETAIRKDVRSGLNSDSKERAVQLENSEVLNALSDDAHEQIQAVRHALDRLDNGQYGICEECGDEIVEGRLRAYPQTVYCTPCAQSRSA